MGFEVTPTGAGRGHGLRPVLVVSVILVGIVVVAIATGRPGPASSPPPPGIAAASTGVALASPSPGASLTGSPTPSPILRSIPATLTCHGLASVDCTRIALAAVQDLPPDAPVVRTAAVWSTILCDSDLDCPASRLRGHRPLGSAILGFGAGGPTVWVDVVEPATVPRGGSDLLDVQAWIIRWID